MVRVSNWVTVLFTLLAVASCQKVSSRQDLENIQLLESKADTIREAASMGRIGLDTVLLDSLGRTYVKWAENYPDAPETPEFLFRAGELYSNELKNFPKAIEMFEKDYTRYPQHKTAANALFFIGYLYHNSLNDLAKAEKYYKEFLEKYPQHSMAKDAKFELESLGMTPELLYEKIMGKDSAAMPGSDSSVNSPSF